MSIRAFSDFPAPSPLIPGEPAPVHVQRDSGFTQLDLERRQNEVGRELSGYVPTMITSADGRQVEVLARRAGSGPKGAVSMWQVVDRSDESGTKAGLALNGGTLRYGSNFVEGIKISGVSQAFSVSVGDIMYLELSKSGDEWGASLRCDKRWKTDYPFPLDKKGVPSTSKAHYPLAEFVLVSSLDESETAGVGNVEIGKDLVAFSTVSSSHLAIMDHYWVNPDTSPFEGFRRDYPYPPHGARRS